MRKRIGIEDFLRWAYRDELPKAQPDHVGLGPEGYGGAWGGIEHVAELGTLVDVSQNRYGVVPDRYGRDDPHMDAVRAAVAVEDLSRLVFQMPEGWNPVADFGDLGELGAAAIAEGLGRLTQVDLYGQRQFRLSHLLAHLVRRYALLRDCPAWEGEVPTVKLTRAANGRPAWFRKVACEGVDGPFTIEVPGTDKRGHPMPDAYQKSYLDPCPLDTIVARAEYELWRAALDLLHADLAPRVTDYAIEPCTRPYRPWETGGMPKRRVLHSLLQVAPMPQKAANRPLRRAKRPVSPVRAVLAGAA